MQGKGFEPILIDPRAGIEKLIIFLPKTNRVY